MSKLISGYTAVLKRVDIKATICRTDTDIKLGSAGELTIWESENLHPGECYVRFKPEAGEIELRTSCGQIEIKDSVLTIYTQNGSNTYSFDLGSKLQPILFEMKLPERFLHICTACGKREVLSSKEAFDQGWDYPGPDGIYKDMQNYGFGIMAPRTCGNCGIDKSLYWKIFITGEVDLEKTDGKTNVDVLKTVKRIQDEPMSLIVDDEIIDE